MRQGVWAIIPVKRFATAKQRLSGRWRAEARARLAAAMLEDVVSVLAQAKEVVRIVLVTGEDEARPIATRHGAEILLRQDDDGINPAVAQGLEYLDRNGASRALVVPGDVPFATPDEIDEAVSALGSGNRIVLVPARRDGGTNLLGMTLPLTTFPLAFGTDSLARHIRGARDLGIEPAVLHLAGLATDIDVPEDLVVRHGRVLSPRTAEICKSALDQL